MSALVKSLDAKVKAFPQPPVGSQEAYAWVDAITQKIREGGRMVSLAVVLAVA